MRSRSDLIRELASELEPAPRLRSVRQLALLWWIGAWLFVVAASLWVAPLRPGVGDQLLHAPRFAAETLFGLLAGALTIGVAFGLGSPGSGSPRRRTGLALGALAVWTGAYLYGLFDPALEPSELGARPLCFGEVLIYGFATLIVGLLLLRRLAPLARWRAGFVMGAAASAVPGLFMQLACMYIPSHILIFHLGPVLGIALLGAAAGPLLLRRI